MDNKILEGLAVIITLGIFLYLLKCAIHRENFQPRQNLPSTKTKVDEDTIFYNDLNTNVNKVRLICNLDGNRSIENSITFITNLVNKYLTEEMTNKCNNNKEVNECKYVADPTQFSRLSRIYTIMSSLLCMNQFKQLRDREDFAKQDEFEQSIVYFFLRDKYLDDFKEQLKDKNAIATRFFYEVLNRVNRSAYFSIPTNNRDYLLYSKQLVDKLDENNINHSIIAKYRFGMIADYESRKIFDFYAAQLYRVLATTLNRPISGYDEQAILADTGNYFEELFNAFLLIDLPSVKLPNNFIVNIYSQLSKQNPRIAKNPIILEIIQRK